MSETIIDPAGLPSVPDAAAKCCKCEAYREIIADQQARIARLTELAEHDRQFAGYITAEVERVIGKKK